MRPVDRSMNVELTEGMVDGKVKKANPNRGGLPEAATELHRQNLNGDYDQLNFTALSDERPDIVGLLP